MVGEAYHAYMVGNNLLQSRGRQTVELIVLFHEPLNLSMQGFIASYQCRSLLGCWFSSSNYGLNDSGWRLGMSNE